MNWELKADVIREFISDTRLCYTACRYGKTLKDTRVLYPCTTHIKAAFPQHLPKQTFHDCQPRHLIYWRRDQRKDALELCQERL